MVIIYNKLQKKVPYSVIICVDCHDICYDFEKCGAR